MLNFLSILDQFCVFLCELPRVNLNFVVIPLLSLITQSCVIQVGTHESRQDEYECF